MRDISEFMAREIREASLGELHAKPCWSKR